VGGPLRWRTVLLMPIAGRCSLLLVMAAFPYARANGGLATIFRFEKRWSGLVVAWAVIAIFVAGWLAESFRGVVAAAGSIAVALLFAAYCRRKVGGYTGDTLGATSEIVELVPPLVIALWGA
jgi:adenosylcobinamide-GDP ribazoletransferase